MNGKTNYSPEWSQTKIINSSNNSKYMEMKSRASIVKDKHELTINNIKTSDFMSSFKYLSVSK